MDMRVKAEKNHSIRKNNLQDLFIRIDMDCIRFLREWSTLIAATLGVFLFAWGIVSTDYKLVIEVLLTGAVSYSIGFVPALIGDLIMLLIRISGMYFTPYAAIEILQFLGCAYIAWLGFQHQQLARANRQQLQHMNKQEHPSHVITWNMVNEVRNSLLAMRLLLFQQAQKQTSPSTTEDEIKMVEEELLRLELIFGSLTKHDENPLKKSGT